MRAVNLLPSDASAARSSRGAPKPVVLAGAIAGVVVVAIVGGGNLLQLSRVSSAQKSLNAAKLLLAATPLPPAAPKVTPPPAAVAQQMAPRMQAVSSVLAQRVAWDRVLREFSLVLPSDIQLSSLALSLPGSSASQGLTLNGLTFSNDDIARLLARMQLVPDFSNVTLSNTSTASGVVSFMITANVKGASTGVAPTLQSTPAPVTTTTSGGSTS
jgi:Tfp pilus assembly protein PilN